MRIAILADTQDGYKRPAAEGLHRMLRQLNVESKVFYDGLKMLDPHRKTLQLPRKRSAKIAHILRDLIKHKLACLRKLRTYDIIVVVLSIPSVFQRDRLVNIEKIIRKFYPDKIIVAYSNYYLLTREYWLEWLKQGNPGTRIPTAGNFGLERFDWYLCVSVVSEYPMPPGMNPYSHIGANLDDGTLYPAPKERFIALIDFEKPYHMHERMIQIRALEETNTEYIVLHGRYKMSHIREIYRQCSLFFLAHRESFGYPICELQACGSYIFSPYSNWCSSHWLKDDLSVPGEGVLPENFIIYNNDLETLKREILRLRQCYDLEQEPCKVFDSFVRYYPQLFYGDREQLRLFLDKVERKEITSTSHLHYDEVQQTWYRMHADRNDPHNREQAMLQARSMLW